MTTKSPTEIPDLGFRAALKDLDLVVVVDDDIDIRNPADLSKYKTSPTPELQEGFRFEGK